MTIKKTDMTVKENRSNIFRSTNGECGDAYDNGIMKLTEPTTAVRGCMDDIEDSSYSVSSKGNVSINQIVHGAYEGRRKDLDRGWDYVYPDEIMPKLMDHDEYSGDLNKLREYSPYDHAVTKQWATQIPFFDASNNYIYAHDHKERMTDEHLVRLNKGVFTLPNMPLNRNENGKKNSHIFGEDRNARSVRCKPGIGSDDSITPYFLDRLKYDDTPFYIGRLDGTSVINEPDFKHRPADGTFYNCMVPKHEDTFFEHTVNVTRNNIDRKDKYYLSICPVDEDFRPCEGTTWYNTSGYGVAIVTRDGFSRVVLPNMDINQIAEVMMNNDFGIKSSASVTEAIGNRKGLWAMRTIQGGLDSLRENLRTLGLLDKLDKKVDGDYLGKERSKDVLIEDITGLNITIGDVRRSFGNFEELIAALDGMEPPMSTRDKFVENSGNYVTKPDTAYLRPYTNGVIYGLTIAFFISEEDIRKSRSNRKAMYDPTLDVVINPLFKDNDGMVDSRRYGTVTPILHPHVYDNIVRKIAIRQHDTLDVVSVNLSHFARDHRMPSLYSVIGCILVSRDVQTLYKRAVVGGESSVIEIKSLIDRKGNEFREGISDLLEGVYILQDYREAGEMVQIRIDINDKDKLKEHGIYYSKVDAEAFIVDKQLEDELKRANMEIAKLETELKLAKVKQGDKALDHADRKLEREEQSDVAKAVIDMMERERKSNENMSKHKAEQMSAMSNMLIGTGTILAAAASLGTLAMKYMSAKTATATVAKAALSAAGSSAISTGVGTALGVVAKVVTAAGAGIAAASSTPLVLVGLGLAAVGGLCAWAAGWFD